MTHTWRSGLRNILLGALIFFLQGVWRPVNAASSLQQEAQAAWNTRDQPGKTEEAIRLWQEALKTDPGNAEILIALTKACGRAVRHASKPADEAKWAERAKNYGTQAVAKGPPSAEAYAYYGEALGQWANAHKGVGSLKFVRKAVEALQKAIAINPKYSYAHMLLAEFYRQSPRMISVGDKAKAVEQAKLAVDSGPGYAINHLVLARAYLDSGKKESAIAQLQAILTLTPPADAVPETHADQETAKTMLKDLGAAPTTPSCGEAGGICTETP